MSNSTVVPGLRKEEWTQAAHEVGSKADQLVAQAGSDIQEIGNSLGRNLPHSGMLGSVSQSFAGAVQQSGEYLEDQKLSGMAKDVTCMIRRNPIPSVLISAGIGWFIARRMWK